MGNTCSSSTLSAEMEEKLADTQKKLEYSDDQLQLMKARFLEDMSKGWEHGKGAGCPPGISSLKMLTSHVNSLPDGTQEGTFYALDLGGTNLRVLRVELRKGEKAEVAEHRKPIKEELMSAAATGVELFDFIADTAKELTDKFGEKEKRPAGFTFSFPMSQSSVKQGRLVEWTKGFETKGVVGEDPAALLEASFEALGVPLTVVALCNDTVGTLMTCAYQFDGCPTSRIGVILGTGTNAAYQDPALGGLVVNIEWGAFDKELMRSSFDEEVDRKSPNKGKQFFEKMISGMYLGELTRLAALEVLGEEACEKVKDTSSTFLTADVGAILDGKLVEGIPSDQAEVLRRVGSVVLDRAALLTSVALAAVADKIGVFKKTSSTGEERRGSNGQKLTIGFDGSLYTKGHEFEKRLQKQMARVMGQAQAQMVHTVHSEDGSGVGAALVAAAVSE